MSVSCILCNLKLENRELLAEHFRICGNTKANGPRLKAPRKRPDESSKVPCDVCEQKFKCISMAIQHKYRTHPDALMKYFCGYCGMQFPLQHTHNQHVGTVHNNDLVQGDYPCPECMVPFVTEKGLNYHRKSAHNRVSSLIMPVNTPPPSKKIRINNANEPQSVYYCYLCGFPYINKFNLQRHLERNHTEEERNTVPEDMLKCNTCDAFFYTKQAYESHVFDHKPDDLYVTSEEQRLQTVTRVDQDFDIRRVQLPTEKFIPTFKAKRKPNQISVRVVESDKEMSPASDVESSDEEKKVKVRKLYAIVDKDGTVTKTMKQAPKNGKLTTSTLIKLKNTDIMKTLSNASVGKKISVKGNASTSFKTEVVSEDEAS